MEITIENLQIGDEILILGQVPKLLVVLELPVIGTPSKWSPHRINYKNVRCRNNVQVISTPSHIWSPTARRYLPGFKNIKTNVLETCEVGEGESKKVDLNHKRMWKINY
jgi:hypothetical protein